MPMSATVISHTTTIIILNTLYLNEKQHGNGWVVASGLFRQGWPTEIQEDKLIPSVYCADILMCVCACMFSICCWELGCPFTLSINHTSPSIILWLCAIVRAHYSMWCHYSDSGVCGGFLLDTVWRRSKYLF